MSPQRFVTANSRRQKNLKVLQKITVEKNPDMESFEMKIPRAPCTDFIFTLIKLVFFLTLIISHGHLVTKWPDMWIFLHDS